jgi:hypothetical protein
MRSTTLGVYAGMKHAKTAKFTRRGTTAKSPALVNTAA